MVGFGERDDEVERALGDLRDAGVEIVTIGQYLRPSEEPRHVAIAGYIAPEKFADYERKAYSLGFLGVASGPFVRSSYRAAEAFLKARRQSD
jgi:lipoic acid synthetase